jgi:DNA-binding transcriptional regulator YiaG
MNNQVNEKRQILGEFFETAIDLSHYCLLLSQAVFANFLNVSVSSVQKWESPESGTHPNGAAAKLLQLIEEKGIDVVFV